MSDSLERLFSSVLAARERDPALSRTSKLFRDGVQKMAKKLAEEAIEVGLDAVQMNRDAVVLESADCSIISRWSGPNAGSRRRPCSASSTGASASMALPKNCRSMRSARRGGA